MHASLIELCVCRWITCTYVVVAHGVHVVLQVTLPIVGQDDPAQFPVSSEVEACVCGEHQQTGHVPPADLLLSGKQRKAGFSFGTI